MHDPRQTYADARDFFLDVVGRVQPDHWDLPGLGVWSVRELIGHTCRAIAVVERDLAAPESGVSLDSAADFFATALAVPGVAEINARLSREFGATLGADPIGSVRVILDRVSALLATLPDDRVVTTPFGGLRLPDYVPTKTFELIVHTLDIAEAIGLEVATPADALADSVEIAVALALRSGRGPVLLQALTGRRALPPDFGVM